MTSDILLAGFDLDGTILQHDSSWAAIHRHFGTEHLGAASLRLYTEGKIDYKEFMRRDISSWPKGVTRTEIEQVLSGYKIRKEAPGLLRELKRRGMKVALVTSGIDILARDVATELQMDHWVANGLRFDSRGRVKAEGIGRVDPTRKDVAYRKLLRKLGIPPEKTIAVGDTIYDLAFLKTAAMGFMLAHTTRVSDPAIIHIDSLSEILDYL
jgi:phosphoserine phosphatase